MTNLNTSQEWETNEETDAEILTDEARWDAQFAGSRVGWTSVSLPTFKGGGHR